MTWLEHPLLGNRWELTGGLFVALVLLVAAVLLQWALVTWIFVEEAFIRAVPAYDGFFTVMLAAVAASWILAIVGAWANGGPALVTGLAILPTATGELVRGHLVMTVDLAGAMGAATAAVWLAAWVSYDPGDRGVEWAGALGALVTGLGGFVVWRGTESLAPYAVSGGNLARGLYVAGVLFGIIWAIAQARDSAATRS